MKSHLLQKHGIEVTLSGSRSGKARTTGTQSVEDLFQQLLIQFNGNHQELDNEIIKCMVDQQLVDQTLLDLIVI